MKTFRLLKICAYILSAVLLLTACGNQAPSSSGGTAATAATQYANLFEKDSVAEIRIQIDDADWQSILDNPTAEEYHTAAVTFNGQTVENVGFRTKGNLTLKTTASSDSNRYSFRIKFDKYVDKQKLLGMDEMVVNNMAFDPSYLREYLTYEALRELGVDTPLTVFANIYINDELFGFYLCIEAVDDSYLKRVYGNNDGNLYKADQGSTLTGSSSLDTFDQKNGDDVSKEDLSRLVEVLNAMPDGEKGDIESVLDVDSVLKYLAVNSVLSNEDSYAGAMAQNYYLYNQNGVFSMIPWDYNMSFGTGMNGGNFSFGNGGGMGGPGGNRPQMDGGFDSGTSDSSAAAGDGNQASGGGQMMQPPTGGTPPQMPGENSDGSAANGMPGGFADGERPTPPNGFGDGNRPQMPDGFDGTEPPELPDGFSEGEMPEGFPGGFGGGMGGNMNGSGNLVTAPVAAGGFTSEPSQRPLCTKLLAVEEYKERYLQYVQQLIEYLDTLENGRISEIAGIIRSHVQADPSNFYTAEQFEEQVTGTEASDLYGFVTQRLAAVREELSSL
ncbi:MAG: hypothetical protein HFE85_01335 [Clostridiales bacterium]|nr:hypothetical protein [Clostridiales bacterium]